MRGSGEKDGLSREGFQMVSVEERNKNRKGKWVRS